jgi:uncharacterized lipoprotein YmbA
MKFLTLLLTLLLFTACGSKKFYTLGDNLDIQSEKTYSNSIDVVKVTLPKYLHEHQIVRKVTEYQIEFIPQAHWLIPMEKNLTDILINYLQHSMNNPNVHLYPWESNDKATTRISVEVKKFIASDKEVLLKANYKIVNLQTKEEKTKQFQTHVQSTKSMESMIQNMEKAYLRLLKEIKNELIKNEFVKEV